MKLIYKLFAISAIATLASCNSDQSEYVMGDKFLELTTTIEQLDTRAGINATSFDYNDSIGVYAYVEDGENAINNVSAAYIGGKWNFSTPIALKDKETTIYAYYPYDKDNYVYCNEQGDPLFSNVFRVDARTQTNYLFASASASKVNNKASLTFKHVMAKVTFNITSATSERKLKSVEISGIRYLGYVNIYNIGVEPYTETGTVTSTNIKNNESTTAQAEFLLLPDCPEQTVTLTYIYSDDSKYDATFKLPKLTIGKSYTYSVTVGDGKNN